MYWPIGPPKAYALAKHRSNTPPSNSHDGSEASRDDAPSSTASEDEVEEEKVNGRLDTHEGDNEILAARISRGGSIFATITRSQLTVHESVWTEYGSATPTGWLDHSRANRVGIPDHILSIHGPERARVYHPACQHEQTHPTRERRRIQCVQTERLGCFARSHWRGGGNQGS
jgi:hypothetical protein